MTAHPSDLALEAFLITPERSPVKSHLDGCDACKGRVARMQSEGDEFRQYVFPATVDAVREAAAPRRSRWASLFAPVAALAAVGAAALLVVRVGPSKPPSDYVGTKGTEHEGRAGLQVFMDGPDGARAVEDGSTVPAGAALRFKVKADDPHCYLWIASVDSTGAISRLFPPQGAAVADVPPGPVPGGAILDGKAGLERVFAVCADTAQTTWEDVRRAASPAVGGADVLRRVKKLGEPLADECQSSILLEKRP
jgi:hypothetical protein